MAGLFHRCVASIFHYQQTSPVEDS